MYSEKQFEHLFKEHYEAMYNLAFSMLRDEEESRDVVHDVFARIWEKQPEIRTGTERAYLLNSVRNGCANRIRALSQEERLRKLYPEEIQLSLNAVQEAEQLEHIRQYMENDMPPDTRTVLQLCIMQDQSYKQASEQLQMSVGYINKQIVKGLRMLRDKFNPKRTE